MLIGLPGCENGQCSQPIGKFTNSRHTSHFTQEIFLESHNSLQSLKVFSIWRIPMVAFLQSASCQVNLNITNPNSRRWGLRPARVLHTCVWGAVCGFWEALYIQLTKGAFQIQIERCMCQTMMLCLYEGGCGRHAFPIRLWTVCNHWDCDNLTYSNGNSKWCDLIPSILCSVWILFNDHILALVVWESRQNKDTGVGWMESHKSLVCKTWHPAQQALLLRGADLSSVGTETQGFIYHKNAETYK